MVFLSFKQKKYINHCFVTKRSKIFQQIAYIKSCGRISMKMKAFNVLVIILIFIIIVGFYPVNADQDLEEERPQRLEIKNLNFFKLY